ncbi:hypothetical protein ACWPKO_32745 (plasmid) [Coraliomargarita sp. W4R53]
MSQRNTETQAINSLIGELHRRRALAPAPNITPVRRADRKVDYRQAGMSVIAIRQEIRATRDAVRFLPKLQAPLAAMTRACNDYLENSTRSPNLYLCLLAQLSAELGGNVQALAAARRGVEMLVPGDGALSSRLPVKLRVADGVG